MIAKEFTLEASGGMRLFCQHWNAVEPRGLVGIIHGVGDHCGRFQNVIHPMVTAGFTVFGVDLRGHGHSAGRRIHVYSWDEYREDLSVFVDVIRNQTASLPLFIYGHSMGALITAEFLTQRQPTFDGVILSGIPLIPGAIAKPHLIALARALSRIWPTFALDLGVEQAALSRDAEVVKAYGTDPLVSGRVSVRWGTETLAAIERVKQQASNITLPVLILHGEADRLNLPSGSKLLYDAIKSTDKTLRFYPGGFHEPHNDLNHAAVAQDVIDWLRIHS